MSVSHLTRNLSTLKEALPKPPDDRFVQFLNTWHSQVTSLAQFHNREGAVDAHEAGFKDELQRNKNALRALGTLADQAKLVGGYLEFCLPQPADFVQRVLAGRVGKKGEVKPWAIMSKAEKTQEVQRAYHQVSEALRVHRPDLTPLPLVPALSDEEAANNLLDRLQGFWQLVYSTRHDPATRRTLAHLQAWRNGVAEEVRLRGCQKQLVDHAGAFEDEVQTMKNELAALRERDIPKFETLFERYFDPARLSPLTFIDKVLARPAGPSLSVKPFSELGEEERSEFLAQALVRAGHPPQGEEKHATSSAHRHHPSPAHPPHPSHPHSVISSANPAAHQRRPLTAEQALVAACKAVFIAGNNAGVGPAEQEEWLDSIKHVMREAGPLPSEVQREMVKIVRAAATVMASKAADPDGHKTAEVEMWKSLEQVREVLHSHASEAYHSLGSSFPSSHPFHRLSHRQRVIYGRTFSSPAY